METTLLLLPLAPQLTLSLTRSLLSLSSTDGEYNFKDQGSNLGHRKLLDHPFTEEEVQRTVFQIGAHKAPGIDDKPGFFYQHYWNIVLVNRLITPYEKAFIPGRNIVDNIMLGSEIIHTTRQKKKGKGLLGLAKRKRWMSGTEPMHVEMVLTCKFGEVIRVGIEANSFLLFSDNQVGNQGMSINKIIDPTLKTWDFHRVLQELGEGWVTKRVKRSFSLYQGRGISFQ
ncbi:hypothetical protein GOBAR_AA27583 [Gossypium barbadense]|uniref:Uncharacterized protein n=1 Tax=Gossypium barbadense TaxID=3634 RepID=A0A2P5WPS9_GOSBA|nr:hypothetical protein GOBAR_AA27583 [Gossypium barbadense]